MLNKILDHLFGPEEVEEELEQTSPPVNLLIVDTPIAVSEFKKMGAPRGCRMYYSTNLFEAARLINSGKIHAVLCDSDLPHGEALNEVFSRRFGDLIIFRMGTTLSPINSYLVKPFSQKEYLKTLQHMKSLAQIVPEGKIKKVA